MFAYCKLCIDEIEPFWATKLSYEMFAYESWLYNKFLSYLGGAKMPKKAI